MTCSTYNHVSTPNSRTCARDVRWYDDAGAQLDGEHGRAAPAVELSSRGRQHAPRRRLGPVRQGDGGAERLAGPEQPERRRDHQRVGFLRGGPMIDRTTIRGRRGGQAPGGPGDGPALAGDRIPGDRHGAAAREPEGPARRAPAAGLGDSSDAVVQARAAIACWAWSRNGVARPARGGGDADRHPQGEPARAGRRLVQKGGGPDPIRLGARAGTTRPRPRRADRAGRVLRRGRRLRPARPRPRRRADRGATSTSRPTPCRPRRG